MKPNPHRRGLTLVAVISMFVLISGALIAMSVVFATESRRTTATLASVQLRQLLLAAEPIAAQELRQHGARSREVEVPLRDSRIVLKFSPDGEQLSVHVTATHISARAAQVLTYRQAAGQWQLQSAVLEHDYITAKSAASQPR